MPSRMFDRLQTSTLATLGSDDKLDLAELHRMWLSISAHARPARANLYSELGHRILRAGSPLLAYDVLDTGLRVRPGHVRMRQLKALALAESGATGRAQEILEGLVKEKGADGETLGILARTWKDLARVEPDRNARRNRLNRAHRLYARAYQWSVRHDDLRGMIYSGINTASTALLLGRAIIARRLASRVQDHCLRLLRRGAERFWATATLGEAALILGHLDDAAERYAAASRIGAGQYRELSSARRQARMILRSLGLPGDRLDGLFSVPAVVVFAGHMIDQPDRRTPRFPPALEGAVRDALTRWLEALGPKVAYSSAACGSDILFLEALQREKAEYWIVLPFPEEDFLRSSVSIVSRPRWTDRYRAALANAAGVIIASDQHVIGSDVGFGYGTLYQDGLARLRARSLDTDLRPLAVWDGVPSKGSAGTGALVRHWRSQGLEPDIIDLRELLAVTVVPRTRRRSSGTAADGTRPRVAGHKGESQQIMTMLFADVRNYTLIHEEAVPEFVKGFLGGIARLMARPSIRPVYSNEWGDALYMVFDSVERAGRFALAMSEWARSGILRAPGSRLPRDVELRIALHVGPVYACHDPITKRRTFTGWHVSRAARIEPITPPGQVYASEPFAAFAASTGVEAFACDYVGHLPLAKGFGRSPIYHVRSLTNHAAR